MGKPNSNLASPQTPHSSVLSMERRRLRRLRCCPIYRHLRKLFLSVGAILEPAEVQAGLHVPRHVRMSAERTSFLPKGRSYLMFTHAIARA